LPAIELGGRGGFYPVEKLRELGPSGRVARFASDLVESVCPCHSAPLVLIDAPMVHLSAALHKGLCAGKGDMLPDGSPWA
jgi:hypothetical protein